MKLFIPALFLLSLVSFSLSADARERNRSGTYQTERGSGTWQNKVNRDGQGNLTGETRWQNERGEGSSIRNRSFDSETRTGNSNRTTTNAQGQTATTNKTFTGNQDGTGGTVTGSRTGFQGATQDLNKTYTKNEDGSVTVNTNITGTKASGEAGGSYSATRTYPSRTNE